MADKPITETSVIQCVHTFPIKLTGNSLLKIAGSAVVTANELSAATISCTNQTKCTKIASSKTSNLLKVNGAAVVLGTGLKTDKGDATVTIQPVLVTTE